ncbi:hypothetical protein T492DRAFT_981055 [Pavlovales sp. CCMP2436]|nr:hypothetical protein T492DRAFT_981055 [Pavlovales sp. CCMP2436]
MQAPSSGERPYACDVPGCARPPRSRVHKRTHSGERPYACDEPGCQSTGQPFDSSQRSISSIAVAPSAALQSS